MSQLRQGSLVSRDASTDASRLTNRLCRLCHLGESSGLLLVRRQTDVHTMCSLPHLGIKPKAHDPDFLNMETQAATAREIDIVGLDDEFNRPPDVDVFNLDLTPKISGP